MITIVDFSLMYYRMLFPSKRAVIENSDYFAHLLMNGVLQSFKDFTIDKKNRIILAIDCKKASNWRTKYYAENSKDFPEYKGQKYKGNRVKDQEVPWDKLYEILADFLETMINFSDVQVIQHIKAEADDVIAAAVKLYERTDTINIISNDKDFQQLVSKNVKLFDPIKRKYVQVEKSKELLLEHILTGQGKKDNIFPVKRGFGPATARKKMNELPKLFKEDPGLKERFGFNRKLIDLDLMPDDIRGEIEVMLEIPQFSFNHTGLIDFCRRYGLRQHMDNMQRLRLPEGENLSLW